MNFTPQNKGFWTEKNLNSAVFFRTAVIVIHKVKPSLAFKIDGIY